MQLRLVSSPYYRLPQRVEPVEEAAARPQQEGEEASRQPRASTLPVESAHIPSNSESDNARRQYYYSRIEAVVGRTAEALKRYTEIEDAPGREQLQAQLGLDLFV